LEDVRRGTTVAGLTSEGAATVVDVRWFGTTALEVTYKDAAGRVANRLLYRDDETRVQPLEGGRLWTLDADAEQFRLASEAKRISVGYLFDPYLAVTTALVDPLPHQITAVYDKMLSHQPLRFLLADDPGAGKTIMSGLLIKELALRGDLKRCLVVCPGSLVEQWQQELYDKFHIPFDILTRDSLESSRTGNPFAERDLVIARLDQLSRDEQLQEKLRIAPEWDLIVIDEAHKLSAQVFPDEIKRTRRRVLGDHLVPLTRHLLLLTATPHNGKDEEFQFFMTLLDPDRFERQHRRRSEEAVPPVDPDLMRRLLKEKLTRFDGTPLFPPRRAYPVAYDLSPQEQALYEAVTEYVRDEMNRAERIAAAGEGRRGSVVGFALTVLQRRLASSPDAIYHSLARRRDRLEKRMQQAEREGSKAGLAGADVTGVSEEDVEELEDGDRPDAEAEELEERVVDQATAARTLTELRAEIESLRHLETMAAQVRRGLSTKWQQFSTLLQEQPEMFDANRNRRKLIVFTEHRDTLNYLVERIRGVLGRSQAVVAIHGGLDRDERRKAEASFKNDPEVLILVATDAAGEGINLQRAHLMVNYDLPWNPNRLEQRFGRIHRIGQTEMCHLWSLVAHQTREGDVYHRLLEKLSRQAQALGGEVFDVLGKLTFDDRPLRELLIEAVRLGDSPEVRERMQQVIDTALDRDKLISLIEERALGHDVLDQSKVNEIREQMERAQARRLQPHYVRSFFTAAFERLGGTIYEREPRRYEITRVPARIRQRDHALRAGPPLVDRYERVVFDKELLAGPPPAELLAPGHPLLDAAVDLILEEGRDLLRRGAVLVDHADPGDAPRMLCYLEHVIQDGRLGANGTHQIASRRLEFVELGPGGETRAAGYAPFLDYDPLPAADLAAVLLHLPTEWIQGAEDIAVAYAIERTSRSHLDEVRLRTEARVTKTMAAVKERLTREISYWDLRAEELKARELAGQTPRLNSVRARQRADELAVRLKSRMSELERERELISLPPVLVGAAVVVPAGLLARVTNRPILADLGAKDTKRIEELAMGAVMRAETAAGFEPRDVSAENRGYDIESRDTKRGRLRFIEVKGRVSGSTTVTVTRNEILTCLNKPDDFWLAFVEVDGDDATEPRYLLSPFKTELRFAEASVNYDLNRLFSGAGEAAFR
jgi:superfamily II DNA or RNA helicase